MKLTTTGRSVVDEFNFGVYVWQAPDGEFLGDSEGRLLSINSMRGDRGKIEALRKVAAHYGYDGGKPIFWSGKRKISDDESEEQEAREAAGLVPDPLDLGAILDERRSKNA